MSIAHVLQDPGTRRTQMLVYENYNKFISATDTIRSMKSNVDGMDATMHDLRIRLGALSQ